MILAKACLELRAKPCLELRAKLCLELHAKPCLTVTLMGDKIKYLIRESHHNCEDTIQKIR